MAQEIDSVKHIRQAAYRDLHHVKTDKSCLQIVYKSYRYHLVFLLRLIYQKFCSQIVKQTPLSPLTIVLNIFLSGFTTLIYKSF